MKYWIGLPVCAVSLLAADATVVEEIIAKVNGDIVTRTELDRSRQRAMEQLKQQKLTPAQIQQALKQQEGTLLRDRIDQLLLIQRAKDLSINVEPDVSRQIAEIQKRVNEPNPDKFHAMVKEQLGIPFEDYKSELRNSLLTERVIGQEVSSQINIPKSEVEKYYNEHKDEFIREDRVFLREIVLSLEGKDEAEVEKKAKDLVARARKGERFAELARDNSDSQTAQQGGDLGGWKRGDLGKEIADLIWDKEKNYVTDPIRRTNPDGFLILKIEEKHKAGLASLEEVEREIMNKLYGPRMEPKIREYLTHLRQDAFLEIKPGYVDAGAAPGKDTAWKDPAELKPETVTKEEVASRPRRKRLLWLVPIPGTRSSPNSSSKTATMN